MRPLCLNQYEYPPRTCEKAYRRVPFHLFSRKAGDPDFDLLNLDRRTSSAIQARASVVVGHWPRKDVVPLLLSPAPADAGAGRHRARGA